MSIHGINDITQPQSIDRCAWYLRVSTPRQKLEHQREHVARYCEGRSVEVPSELRFEDKEKRHKSAKREQFQRLLDVVRSGSLDWIVICSFDRWGVADVDEFFEFRRLLLKHDVQLYSVVDQMNLTGLNEGDYFRVVAMAIGATKYVEQMAEKNILKMIEMAKQGWAATGNAAFAVDLVCYPLNDICRPLFRVVRMHYMRPHFFRVLYYTAGSRVERDASGRIITSNVTVDREEMTEKMPLREKKITGYRFEPSIETDRLRAVQLVFELYDAGMQFGEISRNLSEQGLLHYDKPFGYHGVEVILSNSVYIGMPAWGKVGVGAYRILYDGGPAKVRRKAADTLTVRKDESQFVRPLQPLFNPIIPLDLWDRVQERLKDRPRTNPAFGKRRTRTRTTHPLNGKLYCPDCDQPMVQGSSMPASGSRGKKTRCFNCGTYRKSSRSKCHANSVGWDRLDKAVNELLETVKGRIERLEANPLKSLREEGWAKNVELTKIVFAIICDVEAQHGQYYLNEVDPVSGCPYCISLERAFDAYNHMHAERTAALNEELIGVDEELGRIAGLLLEGIPSQTVKKQLFARMAELERRKKAIQPQIVPATARAETLMLQLGAIRRTIEEADKVSRARLIDTFIEKAIPRFDVEFLGPSKRRRAVLRCVEFIPRQNQAAGNILPQAMELGNDHRDTGSWRRRA